MAREKKPAAQDDTRRPRKPTQAQTQLVSRAPLSGYCDRPLDEVLWPPRHDGIRCNAMHREMPGPELEGRTKRGGCQLPEVRDAKKAAFLGALSRVGNVSEACRLADVGRRTVYQWLETDPDFAKVRDVALDVYADLIDGEMHARGVDGWDEPQFGRVDQFTEGIIGYVRKKSDQVLLRLAAAVRPEKYGRQLHDLRGKDGAPLGGDLSKLTAAELLVYRDLVTKMRGGDSE